MKIFDADVQASLKKAEAQRALAESIHANRDVPPGMTLSPTG